MPCFGSGMVYILTPGYLGLFCSCCSNRFWKTTWSAAGGEKIKIRKIRSRETDSIYWPGMFFLKIALSVFTNLIGCATLFQGDTCLTKEDGKHAFICLLWSGFLWLATSAATLLGLYREKRINLS